MVENPAIACTTTGGSLLPVPVPLPFPDRPEIDEKCSPLNPHFRIYLVRCELPQADCYRFGKRWHYQLLFVSRVLPASRPCESDDTHSPVGAALPAQRARVSVLRYASVVLAISHAPARRLGSRSTRSSLELPLESRSQLDWRWMASPHLTRRSGEPYPAPMCSFRLASSSSFQSRTAPGAVADLVSR